MTAVKTRVPNGFHLECEEPSVENYSRDTNILIRKILIPGRKVNSTSTVLFYQCLDDQHATKYKIKPFHLDDQHADTKQQHSEAKYNRSETRKPIKIPLEHQ